VKGVISQIPPSNPMMVRFFNGQLEAWDDTPPECFGQVWMPVCIWCRGGPLSEHEGLTCGLCKGYTDADPEVTVVGWHAYRAVDLRRGGVR
jgi:hypothetical protein